jgi:hypothetical protein
LEKWNRGIVGSGLMQCWINGPATGGIEDKIKMAIILKKNPAREMNYRPPTPEGLKPKDLIGVPWHLAFALQEDGWYLRSDIIWYKPNCQPESVKPRFPFLKSINIL